MSDWNPASVEAEIGKILTEIETGTVLASKAYKAKKDALRAFERAYDRAYIAHNGPQAEKKIVARSNPEVEALAVTRDVTDIAYRDVQNTLNELGKRLEGMRTVSASVRQAYQNVGRGTW